jgi:putative ABC transport system ATP-binding protein
MTSSGAVGSIGDVGQASNHLPSAIRCRGVTKKFGKGSAEVSVLRGIDLDVPLGATTFLVGPSGCGKTTLISTIAGLLTANSGTIEILGKTISSLSKRKVVSFRSQYLGFIFQQFNLIPALNASENAALSLVVQGKTLASARRDSDKLLEKLGMGKFVTKHPNQLSGGQQQRVAIARALAHNPQIVICDEPTASLDAESGRTVMELLQEVAGAPSRAVVVVTHDSRIYRFADYIASMSDGVVVRSGPGEEVIPTLS